MTEEEKLNKIFSIEEKELKIRRKHFNKILNNSKYYDDGIILISRGHLYMILCDIFEEKKIDKQ